MTNKYNYVKNSTTEFVKQQGRGGQVRAIFGYPVNVLKFCDSSLVGKYLEFWPVLLVENYQII